MDRLLPAARSGLETSNLNNLERIFEESISPKSMRDRAPQIAEAISPKRMIPTQSTSESVEMPTLETDETDEPSQDAVTDEPSQDAVVVKSSERSSWSTATMYPHGMSHDERGIYHDDALSAARNHSASLLRIGIGAMHEHRRAMRSMVESSPLNEQQWLGQKLAQHYNTNTTTFDPSFKIGPFTDFNLDEYALAGGFSNSVFERARADVTSNRVARPKPPRKSMSISAQRSQMEAWIRQERSRMKGRPEDGDVSTVKKSLASRYRDYEKMATDELRQTKQMYGSEDLFSQVWNAHTEIHEKKLNGHDDCKTCIDLQNARQGELPFVNELIMSHAPVRSFASAQLASPLLAPSLLPSP
jgi:hypothetical protein